MGISTVLDTQVLATSGADGDVLTQQADGTYLAETPSAGGSPGGSTGQIQYNDAGAFGGTVALVYAASGTHFAVTAQAATDVPVVVKAAALHTANLTEWQDSSGVVGAHITAETGFSNTQGYTNSEAFGDGAAITAGSKQTVVGSLATATNVSGSCTAIGYRALSTNWGAVAVGAWCTASGEKSTAIGGSNGTTSGAARAEGSNSVAAGNGSRATASNSIQIGSGTNSAASTMSIGDRDYIGNAVRFNAYTDATRGSAGTAGRVIFNSDDGNLNIDDGTNWILPDGTTT